MKRISDKYRCCFTQTRFCDFVWLVFVVLILVILVRTASLAVTDIGNLFGWLIGASKSPIAAAVSPLVFGLLTMVVFVALMRVATAGGEALQVQLFRCKSRNIARPSSRKANAKLIAMSLVAIILLNLTMRFVYETRKGIHYGSEIREKARVAALQSKGN